MKILSNKLNLLFVFLQTLLLCSAFLALYRLTFWFTFKPTIAIESSLIWKAVYIGLKFDLRLLTIMIFLGFLLRPVSKLLAAITAVFYCIDFATMSYLNERASANLLKLATEGSASLKMVWETYPIIWGLFGVTFITTLFFWLLKRCASVYIWPVSWKSKLAQILPVLLTGGGIIYGQIAYYPLRWSDAYFSTNHFITQFTLNPVLHFAQTFGFRVDEFDEKKALKYFPKMANYLGIPNNAPLNYTRTIPAAPTGQHLLPKGTNVVIIVVESMAHFKTNLGGNQLNPTPHLAQLAKESLYYDRFYVPVQATARSVFSLMTGIPDVAQNKTSSRNPKTVEQHCLMDSFTGYEKFYFLGGSANWGNIEGLFAGNVEGIHIKDSFSDSPRVDVWGISDYHLFENAHKEFDELALKKQPFVAIVQTSGYHRPYTIPENIPNFIPKKEISPQELADNGHSSMKELNSLFFQDFSLGHFMELAKSSRYYENTVFIVFGDHGLPHENAKQSTIAHKDLLLDNWHVPMLVHSKKYIQAGINHQLASELDIFPTILGYLGLPYINSTLGMDLNNLNRQNREIFTYSWWARPAQYGLMEENVYYRGQSEQSGDIYLHNTTQPLVGLKGNGEEYGEKFLHMEDLAIGFYETAKYMLYHNKAHRIINQANAKKDERKP